MNRDKFIGLGFLIFCSLLWFIIIPNQTGGAEESFVPRLSVLCVAIPAFIMMLHRPVSSEKTSAGFGYTIFFHATLPALLLFLLYLVSVNWIGFYLPSAVFLVAALLLFGERKLCIIVGTPAVMLCVIYLVITYFLKFELPQGLLF